MRNNQHKNKLNANIMLLRLLMRNDPQLETSFDAKTQNQKTFQDYYDNMATTAKDLEHPKLQMLLNHLNDEHEIGVDIGAGTGHVGDCITQNKPAVSKMFAVEFDGKFIECIKKLGNEKIIPVHGNACALQIFSHLPKKVDFLVFNSVFHELISYGCNYDKQKFFDSILPNWLDIIRNQGFFFVRDFCGVNNDGDDKNNEEIEIKIKNNDEKNFQTVRYFLQKFFRDWVEPRKSLQYDWNKNLLTVKDLNTWLEIFLSFRWGHLDDLQYKGVIDEEFINFNENYLIDYMSKKGFRLIDKSFYLGKGYQTTFDTYFEMDEKHKKKMHSKGVFLFQKTASVC